MIRAETNNWPAMPRSNVYLNGVTERGGGSVLFYDAQTASITLSSSTRATYVNDSDQLVYWNGSTSTILGSSGSIVSFGLDDALNQIKDSYESIVAHLKSLLINGERCNAYA